MTRLNFCEEWTAHVLPCLYQPEGRQTFPVFVICKDSIVKVFVNNGTMIDDFRVSITNVRSLIKTVISFLNEIGAGLVTGWTGSTLNVVEYDSFTFFEMVAGSLHKNQAISLKEQPLFRERSMYLRSSRENVSGY